MVFMDLAALTWNGYQIVLLPHLHGGPEPNQEQKDYYALALKWLYDSIKAVKVGATARHRIKWPSAKEAYQGYEEEDQAAASLWGHGLGLAALFSQLSPASGRLITRSDQGRHGIRARNPARQTVSLGRAHRGNADCPQGPREIVSNFPVEQITVVDPMPGYSDYGKIAGQ
jgi:hypothetical protein